MSYTVDKTPDGWVANIWDTDEETGAKLLLARVSADTKRSAQYWGRYYVKNWARGLEVQ